MDDVELVLEEFKALDHAPSNATEDAFRNANTLQLIEASSIHILHAVINAGLDEEGTVELDDFRGNGSVKNLKLHHNSVELGLVKLKAYFLRRRSQVEHTLLVGQKRGRNKPSWP